MEVNPYIASAVETYSKQGKDFHEVVTWHLLHGVVMISPEFLCLGHYCKKNMLTTPVAKAEADTGFVTYFAGDMAALKAVSPDGMRFIAFERGFKNRRGRQIYPMHKFKSLIS